MNKNLFRQNEVLTSTSIVTLTIPVAAESINDTVSLGTKYSDVRIIKRKAQQLAIKYLSPEPEFTSLKEKFANLLSSKTKLRIEYNFYFQLRRKRDEDNYSLTAKGFLDALTELGLIPTDDSSLIKFGGLNLLIDKDQPRCEVIITQTTTPIEINNNQDENEEINSIISSIISED